MSAAALELSLRNLLAWSLQVSVLALAAAAVRRVLPVERPGARLVFSQALLVLVLLLPLVQPWAVATAAVDATLGDVSTTAGELAAAAAGSNRASLFAPASAIAVLIGLGAALHLARVAVRLVLLARVGRSARSLVPAAWLAALRDEVAPRAAFAVSDRAGAAATYGYRRPLVLLPAAFAGLPPERQEAVALHELLHARRGDWLFLVAEEALLAVLFFHPAVHWLVDRVRLAREQCVDGEVVRRLGTRRAYLESLVEAARASLAVRAVPAAPFLRHDHLRERVDLLLKEASMSRTRTAAHVAAASLAVLAAVSLSASALPLQSATSPANEKEARVDLRDTVAGPGEPKLVHKVNPVYPPAAKADRVQGLFLIDAVIEKDGSIGEARVVASAPGQPLWDEVAAKKGTAGATTGDPRLAEAAVEAVRQWRYEPVVKNGKPVQARFTITVNFRLQ